MSQISLWVNDYAHSIGKDVHAEVFGESHDSSFEPPIEWQPDGDTDE